MSPNGDSAANIGDVYLAPRIARSKPNLPAYAALEGAYDYNATLLAPLGTKA